MILHVNTVDLRSASGFPMLAGALVVQPPRRERAMSTNTILLIILILLLLGALPTWPYSSGWGYYPSGGLGLLLLILIILLVTGRL